MSVRVLEAFGEVVYKGGRRQRTEDARASFGSVGDDWPVRLFEKTPKEKIGRRRV